MGHLGLAPSWAAALPVRNPAVVHASLRSAWVDEKGRTIVKRRRDAGEDQGEESQPGQAGGDLGEEQLGEGEEREDGSAVQVAYLLDPLTLPGPGRAGM